MTTFADLIAEARQYLMTSHPDRINILNNTIDAVTTTIPLKNELSAVSEGTRLCIDLEEMHVLSISGTTAGSTAEVVRGYEGSTATTHAIDALVYVSPQFSDYRLGKYINRGLEDLSGDLFQIKSLEFAFIPTQYGYNLNTPDLLDVWRVRYNTPGPNKIWPVLQRDDWYIDAAANTTDFPDAKQIVLREGGYPGYNFRISYMAEFAPLVGLADDVLAVSGLYKQAHDLPPLCAAYRLLWGRDIKRTFLTRQPERRRQEEVPVGGATMTANSAEELYQSRIRRERRRLKALYPGAI